MITAVDGGAASVLTGWAFHVLVVIGVVSLAAVLALGLVHLVLWLRR